MVLLIDNYDSFVYNIARYVQILKHDVKVIRNNEITISEIITKIKPSHIIISPGPCTPDKAGVSMDVVKQLGSLVPILGICLGHQAIGQVFGAEITKAKLPLHGKNSSVTHDQSEMFTGISNPMMVARYHSLVVSSDNISDDIIITAKSAEGEIMALRHRNLPIWGVQFHPESILTPDGKILLGNFLKAKHARNI